MKRPVIENCYDTAPVIGICSDTKPVIEIRYDAIPVNGIADMGRIEPEVLRYELCQNQSV